MTEMTPTDAQATLTIASLPARAAARFADHESTRRLVDGEWQTETYAQTCAAIDEVALGLIALGIAPGERVGLLCDTRAEWTVAGYGIAAAGCVVVPVYPTNSARECEWVLGNSDARAVICEDAAQITKVMSVHERLPALAHLIAIDGDTGDLSLGELRARGGDGDRGVLAERQAAVRAHDPYTIIYTSGTTGPPKGVVLTHANAAAACETIEAIGLVHDDELTYLFLPLAHVFAVTSILASFYLGTSIVYYGGDTSQILPELIASRPTYLPSVPRIFEKLYVAAMKLRDAGSAEDQARFDGAIEAGVAVRDLRARGAAVPAELQAAFEAADAALYSRVQGLFGGRIQQAVSGAAPIAPEILRFFYACGVLVLEGWGMTETVALGTLATPAHHRFGTVGRAVPGMEIVIGEDGEVLMRGATVFAEYWRNPEATAETIVDGWLHTGDLGSLDDDGYLTITGRKKDIIITAGGKNLAPANIENDLKQSPYISQAVMHGDLRPYAVALITLDADEILPWAQARGLPEDLAALATHADVLALVDEVLQAANANYAPVEQIKRFAILQRDLSIEGGELTPTLKVKRAVVSERYGDVLDSLYTTPAG
jgi:long-chain acyl-CoA synthetase